MKSDLIQLLNEKGQCSKKPDLTFEQIKELYRWMVLTRTWNDKALSLQRQGRMGTLGSVKGQEASNVGMAFPLQKDDWFVPAFREFGALFVRGVSLKDQFRYWNGDERGGQMPAGSNITPTQVIVAGQLPHAAGIAYAKKVKKEPGMVLCALGDGATSQGDFHESMNMVSLFNLPVVYVVQNNGWAISMPVHKQSASPTIAERAAAYNMQGVRVDGNDVFAVYETIRKYADRARKEQKPALIELVTYRLSDHTTADDASRYRDPKEVAMWQKRDPIDRLRKYLQENENWSDEDEKGIVAQCLQEVEDAVAEFESVTPMQPQDMFANMYHTLPWNLLEQQKEVLELYNGGEVK